MTPVIGVDTRIDERGLLQPWRIALATNEQQSEYRQFLIRLPSDAQYLTPPHSPEHGDLTKIDGEPAQRFAEVAEAIKAMGTDQVHAALTHETGRTADALATHGITIRPVEVVIPDHGYLDNPYGIGGQAGHEISRIVKSLGGPR